MFIGVILLRLIIGRALTPGGGGGALPLWESVGMRRGFAPHFRHLDDLFAPQNLTMSTILFRSCWVPFRNPPFSWCRRSFCPQNWPNLSFHSDLVGSHFELRAAHPDWFLPGVPPQGLLPSTQLSSVWWWSDQTRDNSPNKHSDRVSVMSTRSLICIAMTGPLCHCIPQTNV